MAVFMWAADQVTKNPDLEAEGKAEHAAGKVEKNSDKSKECSRSKLDEFCPEPIAVFGTTDVMPFPPR
jgi:hypothetical protein